MVPTTVVERILGCNRLRTWGAQDEKRTAMRVPIRRKATIFPVKDGYLGRAEEVRLKDISYSGVALLMPQGIKATAMFVVQIDDSDPEKAGKDPIRLLCKVARVREESGLFRLIGASFTHMMASKEAVVQEGESLALYRWVDVVAGTPADLNEPAKPILVQPATTTASTEIAPPVPVRMTAAPAAVGLSTSPDAIAPFMV